MSATLTALVFGALVLSAGSLIPLKADAHARAAPAGGEPISPRFLIAPSSAAPAPTCQGNQLSIAPDFSSGATGHIALELRLHNVSALPCTMQGYATIVLLEGARRPLLTVLHWGPGGFFNFNRPVRLVTLAPGGTAYVALGWAHIPTPGQSCPLAPNLLLLPPRASSARVVALAHGGVDACGGQIAVSAVEPTHFVL